MLRWWMGQKTKPQLVEILQECDLKRFMMDNAKVMMQREASQREASPEEVGDATQFLEELLLTASGILDSKSRRWDEWTRNVMKRRKRRDARRRVEKLSTTSQS